MEKFTFGSDFSGVGAFNQAVSTIGIDCEEIFACDMDKHARRTFIANYGTSDDLELLNDSDVKFIDSVYYREYNEKDPKKKPTSEEWQRIKEIEEPTARRFSFYYPWNVYSRVIPIESVYYYMTSPPCQAFSMAGKRGGKLDKRGILFFNSHEFIQKNKPRFFTFENVKGLLSDNNGQTFQEWITLLGGKSVNGVPTIFPYDESVPYHIYYRVLNARKHGIPQNRERVFIYGIRDDMDNNFSWPMEFKLDKLLMDVLETDVDEKYFLKQEVLDKLFMKNVDTDHLIPKDVSNTIRVGGGGSLTAKHSFDMIKIHANTSKGFDVAKFGDSINFSQPKSKTRRGRVGKGVAQTLDTACNQAVLIPMVIKQKRTDEAKKKRIKSISETGKDSGSFSDRILEAVEQEYSDTILANQNPKKEGLICIPVLTPDRIEKRQNGRRFKKNGDPSFTITTQDRHGVYDGYIIRRLTPVECFRLMGFPDSLVENARRAFVSDSQLYKQAGNSIYVKHLVDLIRKSIRL